MAHGWAADTPAAIVCGASTPDAWTWTGRAGGCRTRRRRPTALPGVLVVGEVVQVREALAAADAHDRQEPTAADEVKYGRN